jgi:hypothetical protein
MSECRNTTTRTPRGLYIDRYLALSFGICRGRVPTSDRQTTGGSCDHGKTIHFGDRPSWILSLCEQHGVLTNRAVSSCDPPRTVASCVIRPSVSRSPTSDSATLLGGAERRWAQFAKLEAEHMERGTEVKRPKRGAFAERAANPGCT